jgi:crotonobetainyl-CoA:carnitine CoA-transferase CaiB-like acyl-CoA transferase
VRYPGPPYAFEKSRWAISRPAPTLGQHTEEVLSEAGLDVASLSRSGALGRLGAMQAKDG